MSTPPVEGDPYLAVNKELHDIFTPLCMEAAQLTLPDAIHTDTPELIGQIDNAINPVTMANSIVNDRAHLALPWDLFLDQEIPGATTFITDRRQLHADYNRILD